MPKRPSKSDDPILFAKDIFDQIIAKHEPEAATAEAIAQGKNPAAVALGKLGGRKGGLTRAANLSPDKRKAIAKKAARARWAKGAKTQD
jgi:hypothetical protein